MPTQMRATLGHSSGTVTTPASGPRGPFMTDALVADESAAVAPAAARARVLAFEAALATLPTAVHGDSDQFPLVHRFAAGLYVREIFIPAGSLLTGKIHKQAHPVFLMQGSLRLYTEAGGVQELHAPAVFIAPPGTKRAARALEDTVWITVHANPTDTSDLAAIEAAVIAPDFAAYDAWQLTQCPVSLVPRPVQGTEDSGQLTRDCKERL